MSPLSAVLASSIMLAAAPSVAQRDVPAASTVNSALATLRDRALADDTAYHIVEGLTTEIGPRPDGSAQEARARDWAVAWLKALGFANVHIEPYTLHHVWVRGIETGEVVGPVAQPLHLTALGGSGATPAAGLTLPVTYFSDLNALRAAPAGSLTGRIAFVSNYMMPAQDGSGYGPAVRTRSTGPDIAAKKGAAAIVIRSIGTDHGRGPHAGETDFPDGVTPIPAAAMSVADAENLERIVRLGRPVTLHLTLTPRFVGDRPSGNVVAEVPGTDPGAGTILIGGHLDSWDLGTGAIDDGAGVAITAAAARLLLDGPRPRRTIRVVWFGDEETGGYGGKAYADAHRGESFALAAESDFGADRVWRVKTDLPETATAVGDRLAVALAPLGIIPGRDKAGSGTDIEPTLARGVAAIDLSQDGTRYFDWHHTPEDMLDRIDPAQLRQNVAAWATSLAVVANAAEALEPANPRK